MPNIYHQSVEEILRTATPEQKLLWNYIFLRFGERVAISQLHISGAIAGTELVTYVARKIFFAYQYTGSARSGFINAPGYHQIYDEANVLKDVIGSNSFAWDTAAAIFRYLPNSFQYNNNWFGRIVNNNVDYINFIGYRIIY